MQQKGIVTLFARLVALACLFSLSHTWYVNRLESKAISLSDGTAVSIKLKLAELAKDTLDLGLWQYTYEDSKGKEMNLGLDLKGGVNMILEVSVKDLLLSLSNGSKNPVFLKAIDLTDESQKSSNANYIDTFFDTFYTQTEGTNVSLASADIFGNKGMSDNIVFDASNEEVEKVIREKIEASVAKSYEVVRARIDRFGVSQPNIQRIQGSGRILVELPGIKDVDRAKKLLTSIAKLEFWQALRLQDPQTGAATEAGSLVYKLSAAFPAKKDEKTLVNVMLPTSRNYIVKLVDTARVNEILKSPKLKQTLPPSLRYAKFLWGAKSDQVNNTLPLYVINGTRSNKPLLDGGVVSSARAEINGSGVMNEVTVSMTMNSEGAQKWSGITNQFKASSENANDGKLVAVVLDDLVYTAPQINGRISGGTSSISGGFSLSEAKDLANILSAGSLPAKAKIIQSEVVGPSLGQEAIRYGFISFLVALGIVFLWMFFYYGRAGLYADFALALNLLFVFGILASFGFVLTLPGIAGIVLTIGMSVDANVILFERVKEELAKGKGVKSAVAAAYSWKGGLSSIIDANVTTGITAVILYFLGEGPVKGFAITLIIGILTSLFTAILITRIFIEKRLDKGKNVSFFTRITKNWFQGFNFDFLAKRKVAYTISAVLIGLSLFSLSTKGLNFGIDFLGGRNYTLRFDQPVNAQDLQASLATVFVDEEGNRYKPKVKTFGGNNQVKVTTKYKIADEGIEVDEEIIEKLYLGVKAFLPATLSAKSFAVGENNVGVMSSQKVGPTIADDIKTGALMALFLSLFVVFGYILIRFKKWQYSAGAVLAVFHDSIIVMGLFSFFSGRLPFSLEIDQAFIAAILTVIGYSLNDTVIVFDRIREFVGLNKKGDFQGVVNKAVNSTLSRTINTSLTTLFVVLVIFTFGGENIRGFMFALLVGIVVGTYSSIFIATPLMTDLSKGERVVE